MKKKIFFAVIAALVVVGGIFYHFKSVELLESKIDELEYKSMYLERFKEGAVTKVPTPEEILSEVNKLRADAGVEPMILDQRLNASALLKAQDMVSENYYSHINPKTKKHGYSYITDIMPNECLYIGENIARGTVDRDAKGRVRNWKESKAHYEAMINPKYKKLGFAEIFDSSAKFEASTMAVQHFCETK